MSSSILVCAVGGAGGNILDYACRQGCIPPQVRRLRLGCHDLPATDNDMRADALTLPLHAQSAENESPGHDSASEASIRHQKTIDALNCHLKDQTHVFFVSGLGGHTTCTWLPQLAAMAVRARANPRLVAQVPWPFEGRACRERARKTIRALWSQGVALSCVRANDVLRIRWRKQEVTMNEVFANLNAILSHRLQALIEQCGLSR